MKNYEAFKYSAINKNFIDSIIKGYIYCAKPESLNDPFDCRIDISESINRAIATCHGKDVSNLNKLKDSKNFLIFIKDTIAVNGVCSFSNKLLKPIMWSHYADEHKGICCMYKIPSDFIDYDKNNIIGMSDVKYGENTLTEALVKIAPDLSSMDNSEIFQEIVIPILTSKGKDWDIEEEVRIIKATNGTLKLQKHFLKQICFGLHTSEKDKELVRSIIKEYGYKPDFCEIVKSNTDFGLNVNDL